MAGRTIFPLNAFDFIRLRKVSVGRSNLWHGQNRATLVAKGLHAISQRFIPFALAVRRDRRGPMVNTTHLHIKHKREGVARILGCNLRFDNSIEGQVSLALRGETRDGRVADTCRREIKVEKIAAQIKGRGLLRQTTKGRFEQKESNRRMRGSKYGRRATPSRPWARFTLQV